jgi:RNA polymerase sigma-70 factor (ECF subfamily)
VVQEAFLTAYRDLGRLRDPARFGLWLRGIVRHTALTALRERDKIRNMARELSYLTQDYTPPEQSLDDAETLRKRAVRLALEALVPNQREVVGLYYLGGMVYADISALLGISEKASTLTATPSPPSNSDPPRAPHRVPH